MSNPIVQGLIILALFALAGLTGWLVAKRSIEGALEFGNCDYRKPCSKICYEAWASASPERLRFRLSLRRHNNDWTYGLSFDFDVLWFNLHLELWRHHK